MKDLLNKIKEFILSLFGVKSVRKWTDCTKSSNWWGKNAAHRAMNALSPKFSEGKFKEYIKFQKDRGCDHVNLFVCNKADGEGGGYSIWGTTPFSKPVPNDTSKMMIKRLEYCRKQGLGIWLWLLADDSTDWNRKILANPQKYVSDLKAGGFLDKNLVSGICLGLELEEYASAGNLSALYSNLKNAWKGGIATHSVSDKYTFAAFGDAVFVQVNPGTDKKKICNFVNTVAAKTGKKVAAFEMEREPDNAKSKYVLENSKAYSVGNW